MKETWEDITDYVGLYRVSNLGNIESLSRTIINKNGNTQKVNGKILKSSIRKSGYKHVILQKFGVRKTYLVHRLVANAFLKNVEDKPEVNHKDGNKSNNYANNLEWVTRKENIVHAFKNNLNKGVKGEGNGFNKYSEGLIRKVIDMQKKGIRDCIIIKELNVNKNLPYDIKTKRRWGHLHKEEK